MNLKILISILIADEIKFQDLILKSSNFPLMGSKQVFFIKNSSKFSKDFELHLSKLLTTNLIQYLFFYHQTQH